MQRSLHTQDLAGCVEERRRNHIGGAISGGDAVHHPDCVTTRGLSSLHVARRIPDYPGLRQIDVICLSCTQKHSRLGLTASTWRLVSMWTVINRVNRGARSCKLKAQSCVHALHLVSSHEPSSDTALVSHDYHDKSSMLKQGDGFTRPWAKLHFLPMC